MPDPAIGRAEHSGRRLADYERRLVARPTASEEPRGSGGLSHSQRHPGSDQDGGGPSTQQRIKPGPEASDLRQRGLDDVCCARQVATHLIRTVVRQRGQNLARIGSRNVWFRPELRARTFA